MNSQIKTVASEDAYTILEMLVAMAVLMVVVSYSSISVINNVSANNEAQLRSEASHAAQQVLDEIRGTKIENLRPNGQEETREILVGKNKVFDVVVEYCKMDEFCTDQSSRHIEISVFLDEKEVYKTETIFTDLSDNSKLQTTYLTYTPPVTSVTTWVPVGSYPTSSGSGGSSGGSFGQ